LQMVLEMIHSTNLGGRLCNPAIKPASF